VVELAARFTAPRPGNRDHFCIPAMVTSARRPGIAGDSHRAPWPRLGRASVKTSPARHVVLQSCERRVGSAAITSRGLSECSSATPRYHLPTSGNRLLHRFPPTDLPTSAPSLPPFPDRLADLGTVFPPFPHHYADLGTGFSPVFRSMTELRHGPSRGAPAQRGDGRPTGSSSLSTSWGFEIEGRQRPRQAAYTFSRYTLRQRLGLDTLVVRFKRPRLRLGATFSRRIPTHRRHRTCARHLLAFSEISST